MPVVRELLQREANKNARSNDGGTPLHKAAYRGHLNVVRELLQRGANINARNHDGLTPLHKAAYRGRPNVVRELVRHGAKISTRNTNGRTPLNNTENNATRSALGARVANKFQNFRKKSIASRRAPKKNLAEKVFSPKRVKSMMNKYGNNWLNKV